MNKREFIKSANPYMPLWEHVPDGEPRVFTHEGETRVYVYGSHDTCRDKYCGHDYVVWSAPVDDLTDWKYHGVSYERHYEGELFAPDVVKKGDTYYLFAAEKWGSLICVATSKTPWGPFENPKKTELGFDPGILIDDDGKVYAYWGGAANPCHIAQLSDDMTTIIKETQVDNPIGHSECPWDPVDDGHINHKDGFFEASSPRKIMGKYVFVYSKRYDEPVPELGVYEPNNGFLSYQIADTPFGPFRDGGDISFNGGEILKDENGNGIMTYQWGNNHGSLAEINGKWYVFYHRQTGENEFSRQAMLEPVDVALGKDGKLYIGDIIYKDGKPVSSKPVEMTSQGPHTDGLDAYKWISAGYACHLYGGTTRMYVRPVYDKQDDASAPVAGISSGSTVGFKYLQFGSTSPKSVIVKLNEHKELKINVRLDSYQGDIVASIECDGVSDSDEIKINLASDITGKHAVYFEFISDEPGIIAEFDRFTFGCQAP